LSSSIVGFIGLILSLVPWSVIGLMNLIQPD
jgi:hypothetical protein